MHGFKLFALASFAAIGLVSTVPQASGQISIRIGAEPSCPYGYYDYAPYGCAPHGYYGPQWFVGGRFVGAGQWFHGPANFHGTVDNHFDPRHGYHGPMPNHGDHADVRQQNHFAGNEERDGRGHVAGGHDNGGHDNGGHR